MLAAACSEAAATDVTRVRVEDAPLRRSPAVPFISAAPASSALAMPPTAASSACVSRSKCTMRPAMFAVAALIVSAPCSRLPCRPPTRMRRQYLLLLTAVIAADASRTKASQPSITSLMLWSSPPVTPCTGMPRMRASKSPWAIRRQAMRAFSIKRAVFTINASASAADTRAMPWQTMAANGKPVTCSTGPRIEAAMIGSVLSCARERKHKFVIADFLGCDEIGQRLVAGCKTVLAVGMTLLDSQQFGVKRHDRALNEIGRWHAAIGVIAHQVAAEPVGWRNMGEQPVMVAIARHVLDEREDFAARLDRVPQQLEHAARHVGVPDHAVRQADQLRLGVTRHPAEDLIDIGQATFEVGLRDDQFARGEKRFAPC